MEYILFFFELDAKMTKDDITYHFIISSFHLSNQDDRTSFHISNQDGKNVFKT